MAEQTTMAEQTKMGLPRTLLAIGFFAIMLGVVVGAATEGSPVAKYIALLGAAVIGAALVAFLVQGLSRMRNGRRPA